MMSWARFTQSLVTALALPLAALPLAAGCTNAVVEEGDAVASAGLIPEGVGEQALTRECATVANPVRGIDVSRWQGTINWDRVANDGVEYAFIRISDGLTHVDGQFDRNWSEAKRVGIRRGAYQFFRPHLSAAAQAELFLNMMGPLEPGDLPPVIDIETTSGLSKAQVAARSKEWIDIVESATGVKPIIYTSGFFFRDEVGSPSWAEDYMLWVAHYTTGCALTPQPWDMWTFHQFTDNGPVDGINGGVDTNRFNGTLADLDAITVGGSGQNSSCTELEAEGGIIDEDDDCVRLGGPSRFLRSVSDDSAVGGGYVWTGTTASNNVHNYGTWTLAFSEAGTYDIAAHIPAGTGASQQARYDLSGAVTRSVLINQSTANGNVALGSVTVDAGDRVTVRLNDNTGESGDLDRSIVFDAVVVTRQGVIVSPEAEPEGEPEGEPSPAPEGEPEGEPSPAPEGEPAPQPEPAPEGEPDSFVDCGQIDDGSVVISEDDACVELLGPANFLRAEVGGHGGGHVWTFATSNANPVNFARYNMNFNDSGRYLVEASLPAGSATSVSTPYTIMTASGPQRVVVNQEANREFVGIGYFDFAEGVPASIEVHDNTGESIGTSKRLVFDAIRLTPASAFTCTSASVTATALNVRHTPSTAQSAAGQIQGGDTVDAMEQVSGQNVSGNSTWVRIRKGSLSGWVSSSFLSCGGSVQPEPDSLEPDSEPGPEPEDGPISEVTHGYIIDRLSGVDADPFNYPETRTGFQEYLDEVGVTFFSATEFVAPNNPGVAAGCGFSELLPPRTEWRRAGALGLLADELRTTAGSPITLRNWWRPTCYNSGVGGASSSDHIHADALDLDFQSSRARGDAQRYLCNNYWAPDFLSASDIAPGSGLSRKLNLSVGLGGATIHVGLLSNNGRRSWKYPSYNNVSNSGTCW